jgi:hypothetical protein
MIVPSASPRLPPLDEPLSRGERFRIEVAAGR